MTPKTSNPNAFFDAASSKIEHPRSFRYIKGGKIKAIPQHNVEPRKLHITTMFGRYIPIVQQEPNISKEDITDLVTV